MGELHRLKGFNVANHFEKRKLLIAINSIAALSIFFFGYDQGMMGGVNTAKDYIELMGFGYKENGVIVITDSLLQGSFQRPASRNKERHTYSHETCYRWHCVCLLPWHIIWGKQLQDTF